MSEAPPTPAAARPTVQGLVLAAGAGRRFGGPKGLARDGHGVPWVARAVQTLRAGGCERVLVTVGARAAEVAALVPQAVDAPGVPVSRATHDAIAAPGVVEVVSVPDWAEGLAASLRAGLSAAAGSDAVIVMPVDTPDAPPDLVRRVLAAAGADVRSALVQAVYGGAPGHPVLLGADHLDAARRSVVGDRGARAYLVAHRAVEVECADLWHGADIDVR